MFCDRKSVINIVSASIAFIFYCYFPSFSADGTPVDTYFLKNIGGVTQAILIRGEDIGNPVMLRLHGGPGYPYFPYLPKKGELKDLEKHYTIVYWEQRGTGASYSAKIKNESMQVDQFVEDAHEVIEFAKMQMHVGKVYIWGHSWGSNIGMLLAKKYPEDIIAYIGTGQSANVIHNEYSCYAYALKKTLADNNLNGYKKLRRIDTLNYDLKDALTVRKWIISYGGVIFSNGEERSYVDDHMLKIIWKTPQYTFQNKINILLHPYFSGRRLWDDMKNINLFEQAPVIDVPVYFFLGRHDNIVSSKIASEYFETLNAPQGKQLIWFENSAHRPYSEEPEKFINLMIHKVLPETWHPQNSKGTPVAGKK